MSRNGWFAVAFGLATLALLAGAFRILGTPAEMAAFERDKQRVADLFAIAAQLHNDAFVIAKDEPKPLPEDLGTWFYNRSDLRDCKDPSTGERYRYVKLSPTRYKLGATFELGSDALVRRGLKLPGKDWEHAPGPHDVELTVHEQGTDGWRFRY